MPTSQTSVQGVIAIVEDVLHALHVPGAVTLGALVEAQIKKRNQRTFETLLEEIKNARDEGVTFEENDVHDFVQMVLRLSDAVEKGTARRNLRLLAQVIIGLKRYRLFAIDNFQRWAAVLETLTRDEILVLGAVYRLMQREPRERYIMLWGFLIGELVPKTFKEVAELQAVCASLVRTGLVLPAHAHGAEAYMFPETIKQLGKLTQLEAAALNE
jgi:hypothetical protein